MKEIGSFKDDSLSDHQNSFKRNYTTQRKENDQSSNRETETTKCQTNIDPHPENPKQEQPQKLEEFKHTGKIGS